MVFYSNRRKWPPHPKKDEESTRKGEGESTTTNFAALSPPSLGGVFSLSFWVVLPLFPSFRWACFSHLFCWVVVLGLFLLWVVVVSPLRVLGWCYISENPYPLEASFAYFLSLTRLLFFVFDFFNVDFSLFKKKMFCLFSIFSLFFCLYRG